MPSRPRLPLLVSFPPFTSPVLTLENATGIISPASPVGDNLHRSKSKRLARVKELLTPIKASSSSIAPTSQPGVPHTKEAVGTDEGFVAEDPDAVGSKIEFFARHPEDSTNPLTFLDGGSGGGTGDTTTGNAAVKAASAKEVQTKSPGKSSSKSSLYPSVFSSSGEPGSYLLGDDGSSEDEPTPSPIAIVKAPQAFTGDDRRRPMHPQRERIFKTRPVTLNEMPGRFPDNGTCYYCCDGVLGDKCKICGLVVRKASLEQWG
ncbi:MAG: hypothetical protein Q9168_007059 [Polycauliona sp. 1 TL-2023]